MGPDEFAHRVSTEYIAGNITVCENLFDLYCISVTSNARWYNRVLNLLGSSECNLTLLWDIYMNAHKFNYKISKATFNILINRFSETKSYQLYNNALSFGYFEAKYLKQNTYDLHGFSGKTAVMTLKKMNDLFCALKYVILIVGIGNHSNGVCTLKESVLSYLKESTFRFNIDKHNAGRIHVYI